MTRLTSPRCNGIKQGYWSAATKEALVQRLAAYEDTGLEPEEVLALKQSGPEKPKIDRYAIFIPAAGKCRLIPCDDGDTCKLETLQHLVGGTITTTETEITPVWAREPVDNVLLIVNDDGIALDLPDNRAASSVTFPTLILGDAVLMAARGEELIGFTKPVCETISEFWKLDLEESSC